MAVKKKILLVEDDKSISKGLGYILGKDYDVDFASTKAGAMEKLENRYDIVILDISLGEESGFDLVEYIKAPIIFLTAHDEEDVLIKGLTMAEEYITKPFNNRELMLRINKVLKRYAKDVIRHGDIEINREARIVSVKGKEISVTYLDYEIIVLLFENIGKIVSRDELFELIYNATGNYVEDNTMSVYIKRIRNKLEVDCIKTITKVGYSVYEI